MLSTINSVFERLSLTSHHTGEIAAERADHGKWGVGLTVTWTPPSRVGEMEVLPIIPSRHTDPPLLCVFANASTKAVATVAYLKVTNEDGRSKVGFVLQLIISHCSI